MKYLNVTLQSAGALLKRNFIALLMLLSLGAQAQISQDFSSSTFPPAGWGLYTTSPMTTRVATVNGYGSSAGMGAVKVDFQNIISDIDTLKTPILNTTIAGDTLIFDHAHAEWPGYTDSMAVFTSSNGGTSWTRLVGLVGSTTDMTGLSTVSGGSTGVYSPAAGDWKTKKYGLAIGTNRVAFVMYSNWGNNLFLDNIVVTRNNPMVFDSVLAVQNIDTVFSGMNNTPVLNIQAYTTFTANPVAVTTLSASTTGTTSTSDIKNVKLWYTGTQGGFNPTTATLLGTINNPSGSFKFTGFNQTLSGGISNFWLTYDVSPSASSGNVLDAVFDSMRVNSSNKVPTISNPSGNKYIQDYFNYNRYCNFNVLYVGSYLIGPTRVQFGTINNPSGDFDKVTNYLTQVNTMYQGDSAKINVTIGPGNNEQVAVYVDWNNNGLYDNPAEEVMYYSNVVAAGNTDGSAITSGSNWIKVPCNAAPGYHRLRVVSDWYGATRIDPCSQKWYGDGEDYTINVLPQPAVKAQFTAVDTFYTNGVYNFTNTSIGVGNTYQWDFQNDGVYDATTKNGSFQYATPGTYTCKLKATSVGCSGTSSDSTTKVVVVINAPAAPTANFISNINVVSTSDIVTFYDLSTFGPGSWTWSISPSNIGGNTAYYYVNGTSASSQNPQVQFAQVGKYTVMLTATNTVGSGTLTKAYYINCVKEYSFCATTATTTSDAAGFLYDAGGRNGNYSANQNCTMLIKPDCASKVTLKFKAFDMSIYQTPGGDWIKVYDGTNASGTPLHTSIGWSAGIQNQTNNTPWLPPTLVANSGAMYIEYHTDGAFQAAGFQAEWSTTPIVGTTTPVATFSVPDTIYTGVNNTYTATATGTGFNFDWDFNNDGVYDASGTSVNYQYNTPMTTTVKCLVSSCTGQTTLTKNVVVLTPTLPPIAKITALFTNGTPNDIFQVMDASLRGPSSWTWTISPATFNFVNGTSATSQNVQLKFNATGTYTVKLKVSNSFGSDSTTSVNYLKVFYYCTPNVNSLNTDIGISNVTFANINNTTPQGVAGYNDYTNLPTTNMDRGGTYSITIKRNSPVVNAINRKVWVDLNGNGSFTDAGEELLQDPGSTSLSFTGNITIPATANLGYTRLRVGVNTASLPNLGCGANMFGEYEDYRINITPDVTKPVITLTGGDTVRSEVGRVFTDPGASATDNVTNPQTYTATYNGFVNGTAIGTVGTYSISYNATDGAGNNAVTKTRWVIVTPDTTRPVITLNGSDSVVVAVTGSFSDPGATATDFYFGALSPVIVTGSVNTAVVGLYNLTYSINDASGNSAAPKVRRVYVVDTIKPVITVNGANPYYWDVKRRPFVDPGVTVTDNYNTGLTATATSINVDSLGTYTITYTARDNSNNQAVSKTRTVIVQDTVKPVLVFKQFTDTFLIDVKTLTSVPEPGYTLSDNYYAASAITVSKVGTVNLNVLGLYPVTYTVTDGSGNTAVFVRIFKVVDREKPVITLTGSSVQNIYRWKVYNDSGATVTDNYDAGLTPVVGGFVDVNLAGIYYLSYNVTDKSGNKADEKVRIVNVIERFDGINGSAAENALNVYPNPNNGKFTLEVKLTGSSHVDIAIYDMVGNKVKDLSKNELSNGKYAFDVSDLAAGNYMIRVAGENETITKKLTIIKK